MKESIRFSNVDRASKIVEIKKTHFDLVVICSLWPREQENYAYQQKEGLLNAMILEVFSRKSYRT